MRKAKWSTPPVIYAPGSTRNQDRNRDPEMHQTKKGNQWYFGMKACVATDPQGIIGAVEVTAASVPDHPVLEALVTGDEKTVLADRGYDCPQSMKCRKIGGFRMPSPGGAIRARKRDCRRSGASTAVWCAYGRTGNMPSGC